MHWSGLFPWQCNLLSLFAHIRIEWYFPFMFRYFLYSDIFCRSPIYTSAEVLLSCAPKNREVSSVKSFTVDSMFFVKSFMYIRKKSRPRIDSCGTPTFTGNHSEVWPLNRTFWNLFENSGYIQNRCFIKKNTFLSKTVYKFHRTFSLQNIWHHNSLQNIWHQDNSCRLTEFYMVRFLKLKID